ncbi:hypothetical protein SNE40_016701 [Patella caerulea]|uniref:Protocadherin-20 n=1 Tax=Patella caerulea TaxID=87958 RepID=A0AAN8J952_PATCE
MIDREKVCEFTSECILSFDVTIRSEMTSFFEIVTVKVVIIDINDNAPKFPEGEITVFIQENVNPGSLYRIEGATDRDRGANNSVQSYEMISSANLFDIKVDKKLDGTSDVRIVVKNVIDREKKDYYRFFIIAKDGGTPPLSGNVTVNINVTDENDNAPVFSENIYDVSVTENTPVYSVIGKIHAMDRDGGANGRVTYRFSPHKSPEVEELFALNPENGDISVRNELQYQSGNKFETIIEASDQGTPPQVSQAILSLRILDVGNNPPLITINPVSSGVGDMILLSEGARIGTVIAHVNIVDKDQGPNGIVSCRCSHDYFSVHRLEGRGYIVQVKRSLNRERIDEHNITVVCQDTGIPRMSARAKFQVKLTDENDNPPVFTKRVFETIVEENNVIGQPIIRVAATDDDLGKNAMVLYYLNLDDDSMFDINQNTGEIIANARFDRETMSEMKFTVRAVDEGKEPMTGTAEVVVRIRDQNDNSPKFDPSFLVFSIHEDEKPGSVVGLLAATDDDFGKNAEVEYMIIVDNNKVPFAVFSNGVIRTEKTLDYEKEKRYTFNIIAKDKGNPPRNTTAKVTVYVMDANDHSPIIVFPNDKNNTITITSDTEPGIPITRVVASDSDEGDNAKLSFYINGGNEDNIFHIGSKTGDLVLARRIMPDEKRENYYLRISVQDQGQRQQASQTHLTVHIVYVNSTLAGLHGKEDFRFIIIAGVVAGITVILSIIIVAVILYIRRADNQRRNGQTVCVQEQGEVRNTEKQLWHSVPEDEVTIPTDEKTNMNHILKDNNFDKKGSLSFDSGTEHDDSYYKTKPIDHYSGQQFFTFKKAALQSLNEDLQSDTSGETTTSDSGRGGSEEDIQLPPLPEMPDESGVTSFTTTTRSREGPRKLKIINSHLMEKDPLRNRSFETFSPRILPSYASQMSNFSNPAHGDNFHDIHPKENRRSFHENQDLTSPRDKSGKKVTFQNDIHAKQKVRDWQKYNTGGVQNVIPFRYGNDMNMTKLGSDLSSRSFYQNRYHDDDDNTTTSGSYTLDRVDLDDMLGEQYSLS